MNGSRTWRAPYWASRTELCRRARSCATAATALSPSRSPATSAASGTTMRTRSAAAPLTSSGSTRVCPTARRPNGSSRNSALRSRAKRQPQQRRRILATYDYRDEAGELVFQVVRYEPKDFRQRRPDGQGGWTWQVKGVRQVPYRLFELRANATDDPVLVVEGEKDVDRLASLGFVATCNAGGANKWPAELNRALPGALSLHPAGQRRRRPQPCREGRGEPAWRRRQHPHRDVAGSWEGRRRLRMARRGW